MFIRYRSLNEYETEYETTLIKILSVVSVALKNFSSFYRREPVLKAEVT